MIVFFVDDIFLVVHGAFGDREIPILWPTLSVFPANGSPFLKLEDILGCLWNKGDTVDG